MVNVKFPRPVGAFLFIAVIILFGFFIPQTQILGNDEIRNVELSFNLELFGKIGIFALLGVLVIYIALLGWKQDDKYTNSFGFFNLDDNIRIFKNKFTGVQLTLYAVFMFSLIFLISRFFNVEGFTEFKFLPQQFSAIDSLVFSTLLIPFNEEMMSLFFMGIFTVSLLILANRYNWTKDQFKQVYYSVIPLLIGFFVVIWHKSAYKGGDISLVIVFFFWAVKTFLVLAFAFAGIGIIMHQINNFILDLSRLFVSDSVLFGTIIVLLGGSGAFIYYFYIKEGKFFGEKT